MKTRVSYFFWLLFLAFSLMILVVATQILTRRNINGLKAGNRDAVITFTINNRLQDLVNLSFELNTKLAGELSAPQIKQPLLDSLNMLDYNASVLANINPNSYTDTAFKKLNELISKQVETSIRIIQDSNTIRAKDIEYFLQMHLPDSIYSTALYIQKELEKDLQKTLNNNNKASGSLSDYNRILAVIAIAAIFIFSAIIMNRNFRQIKLISELEVATKSAREYANVKDQFLANMSHEIRTPLNAIKGFSRLMSLTPLNKEQQQYSSIIYEATNNLVNIVNDILDISKIEAGKLRIEEKDFSIERVLEAVKHLFKNTAEEKGLELSYFIDDDVPVFVKGDPERLSQVLINLVNNSIKFTSHGYVRMFLSIDKARNTANTSYLMFRVQDSGCGIPEDKKDVIFGRFEQLDSEKEMVTSGTGLGLSIVKSLVTLMGGTVYVESELNEGASFFIILPFGQASGGSNVSGATITSEFKSEKKYPNSSVLIVEDNRVNQVLIEHLLYEYGIKPCYATNGREALELLKSKRYDMVLMDIQMPVMDGYACTRQIRNKLKLSIPIVAMTAFALPGEKEKCLSYGMNDYLSKPIDTAELDLILTQYLKERVHIIDLDTSNRKTEREYLLQLAGGDEKTADVIVAEILREIPETRRRITEILESEQFDLINKECHHMLSTFAPLGESTKVMHTIQEIKKMNTGELAPAILKSLLADILLEMKLLENKLISPCTSIGNNPNFTE